MRTLNWSAAEWHRSSHSADKGNCVEVAALPSHRSSHSGGNGDCVEVASIPGAIAARDSKNPEGPRLVLGPGEWVAFLGVLRRGG